MAMISLGGIKNAYRALPDKKRYIEFVSAILTVPVLITVIAVNLNNLNANKEKAPQNNESATKSASAGTIAKDTEEKPTPKTSPTPSDDEGKKSEVASSSAKDCVREVGPVEISFPDEDQTVSNDPLPITISRKDDKYCAIVWAYRINNSAWSDYTDSSLYLYNLTSGNKKLDLKVKSVYGDEIILTREFTYKNSTSNDDLTPTPTASSSATTN